MLRKHGTGEVTGVETGPDPFTPEMDALIARTAAKAWTEEDDQELKVESED